jgi:hypothetical protein
MGKHPHRIIKNRKALFIAGMMKLPRVLGKTIDNFFHKGIIYIQK